MKAIAAAVLLVGTLLVFVPADVEAATNRILTIDGNSAHPTIPFKTFDGNPAKIFDVNNDGRLEIIAQNDNQYVYIFNSQNGALLAELKTKFPAGWGARTFNGPEVALFDSGGTVRLVVENSAAYVTSYRYDSANSNSGRFAFVKEWERRLTDCFSNPGSDSKPTLADLDRDGKFEIVVATEESGIYALRQDGSLYWKNCMGGGNAEPVVADLNFDGWPEVVYGSDGGVISVLNGRTGSHIWRYSLLANFNLHSASIPVGVAVGQVDGLGGLDIVAGARDSHDSTNWANDHALLVALNSNGRLLWAKQDPQGNPLTYTHPVIVDADKDGKNEVYWADWNTIGHKPPENEADSWKVTGPANFYRYDGAGNRVWKQSLSTYWNNKDIALADVDGDGVQEVLANGPGPGGDGIWYLDSRTGARETFVGTPGWKVARGAIVGDLAGNGGMQWLVQAGSADNAGRGAILVFDTHQPYNSVYPHLPYPSLGSAAPPPPPPPPSGTFDATFTIKSPNEWWQEVFVSPSPSRPITKVEMRLNGGPWQGMNEASWGAWTKSVRTVAGTQVEFLATDFGSAQSQSAPFTWLDGQLSKGSVSPGAPPPPPPPPPSSGSFDATFTIKSPNEWWQEVYVAPSTPRTITTVELRVNGGAWQPMTKASWGAWTKSVHTVAGTKVEFLATDSGAAQSQSAPFTWLDGQLTKGSVTPGSAPATFTPTFVVSPNINNWWVEVTVKTSEPLRTVEARVNGGAWVVLPETSWGTWAKSMHVASGSQVQFRATTTGGATAISGTTTWP